MNKNKHKTTEKDVKKAVISAYNSVMESRESEPDKVTLIFDGSEEDSDAAITGITEWLFHRRQ